MLNKSIVAALLSTVFISTSIYADVAKTSVDLGYKFYTNSTEDDNPGVFNQPLDRKSVV